jgi:hemolysin D
VTSVTAAPKASFDFSPDILAAEQRPPSPMPRVVLWILVALSAIALVWSIFGQIDIVATAQGKLIPTTYLQIVQPAEGGVLKEILVREGDTVKSGAVLARMDANYAKADHASITADLTMRQLQLRRIDAELLGAPMKSRPTDRPEWVAQANSQYQARRQAYLDSVAAEQATLTKAQQEHRAATEVESKLRLTLPMAIEHEAAWDKLAKEGFAGRLMALDKAKDRVENEQQLKAQQATKQAALAAIEQSSTKISALTSTYRQGLQNERTDVIAAIQKLEQDLAKQDHRASLLELKAPQDGVVKDLATHTPGSVLQPGTVLMSLVPVNDVLLAEVWVEHDDIGFVSTGQRTKVKLAAYPFQKYGMIEGNVKLISADASEGASLASNGLNGVSSDGAKASSPNQASGGYKALIALQRRELEAQGKKFSLSPGMRATVEIHLGTRSVVEYLLSPVTKTVMEAGRER